MSIATALFAAHEPSDTGASLAWTSDDPLIRKVIDLLSDGRFREAQTLLASDDGHADTSVSSAREEMKEIIERLRHEYSLDEARLLSKLKAFIPDVTADDLTKWRDAGELQYRM